MIDYTEYNKKRIETLKIVKDAESITMYKDEIGTTYGNLTILEYIGRDKNNFPVMLFKCNLCGSLKIIYYYAVKNGQVKSCGCLKTPPPVGANTKHHMTDTRLYNTYTMLKGRCYNPNNKRYSNYGARGIKVCDEWLDKKNGFMNFYKWAIENGYQENLSIDRIDVNGNYEPANCRWVNDLDQARNKEKTVWLKYRSYEFPLSVWAEIVKINYKTLFNRYSQGWSPEEILRTPRYERKGKGFLCWEVDPKYMKYQKQNSTDKK